MEKKETIFYEFVLFGIQVKKKKGHLNGKNKVKETFSLEIEESKIYDNGW